MDQQTAISQWQCHAEQLESINVLPDGCRDLILRIDADQQLVLIKTGLDNHHYQVNAQPGERFYGIRFAAGCRIGLPSDGVKLLKKLYQVSEQPELIQQTLFEWQEIAVLPADNLMNEFIDSIQEGVPLKGISGRSLRRRIAAVSGAAPSFWHGLYRARSVAKSLCQQQYSSDSEAAYHWGYADQSHLCRDMRRWFAQTPGGLRKQAAEYLPSLSATDAFYR